MKKLLLVMGAVLAGLGVTAQNRVIDYPVKGKRTTEMIEFYQVEVSDTAVVLKGDLYNRPQNWVSIAATSVLKGKNTGKSYRLVRATGIEPGKKEYMTDSWHQPFALQFEPVDAKDDRVDFDEGIPGGDGFAVNDIALVEERTARKGIHCRIEGKVVDNPAYSRIMLMPEGADARVHDWISIPVRNGKFAYDLYVDEVVPYEICAWSDRMGGAWRPVDFFAEEGKVNVTLYSLDKDPELESEAPVNKEFYRFKEETETRFMKPLQEEREALMKAGKMETPEMKALHEQFQVAKTKEEKDEIRGKIIRLHEEGKAYTPEYDALQEKSKKAFNEFSAYTLEYIKANPTLVGLHLLKGEVQHNSQKPGFVAEPYVKVYNELYAPKYGNHYLGKFMQNWITSRNVQVGGRFVDFTAPDLEGNLHTLSKEIAGKVALIDLWASWCGPCRRTSISMIPVYEAYKDKGFTIVGVARERKKTDMEKALKQDKYPWLNLIELNDQKKIWEQYGVGNGGGCTYLVGKDGKVLAVHPTAEEVKAILDKML